MSGTGAVQRTIDFRQLMVITYSNVGFDGGKSAYFAIDFGSAQPIGNFADGRSGGPASISGMGNIPCAGERCACDVHAAF